MHFLCKTENPVRTFQSFTADLHEMAKWLKSCGLTSVAMESTGVYWIPAFEILKSYPKVRIAGVSLIDIPHGVSANTRDGLFSVFAKELFKKIDLHG